MSCPSLLHCTLVKVFNMFLLPELSVAELNELFVKAWSLNADHWDAAMGQDRKHYFNVLELPALKRLVQPRPSEYALDIKTGNGLVARWLSSEGVNIMATNTSEAILERAEGRFKSIETTGKQGVVQLQKLNATNSAELENVYLWLFTTTPADLSAFVKSLSLHTARRLRYHHHKYSHNGYPHSRAFGGCSSYNFKYRWPVRRQFLIASLVTW